MQKFALAHRPFRSLLVAGAVLVSAGVAGHAFAECEEAEETIAGKAVATAAAAKVSTAVAVTGKQMLDVVECNIGSGSIMVVFKYNFLGADGLYWIQGSAKVKAGMVTEMQVKHLSPNLTAASAAKGLKLASN
ncbi:hypothetical protein ABI_26690 [Asticcacaulis biprosthecium C19]|uniref:Lipoprotein n=1 Tax=Asticcacaulis biprosthecium C19 TaxID=715226 RepID=F4QPJ6_9CAUL|nr:hypothetical protein [Asticcacaulis biprosthecium]EGF91254.1 hypothetical protein ABI_26690 [Asticcacaulis biprosthecium C19]